MAAQKKRNLLLVTSIEATEKQFRRLYDQTNFTIDAIPDIHKVLKRFERKMYDILVISGETFSNLPEEYFDILKIISHDNPSTMIIFLVDKKEVKLAITAMEFGGYQYAKYPVADDELTLLIETAIHQTPAASAKLQKADKKNRFQQFIGGSAPMQQVYKQIGQAAETDITILLLGETGTGKDLAAQAIHRLSRRESEPFLPVNLGAFPPELVASELFGHEAGAFTGARQSRKGVFEQGKCGTVFLDEIDAVNQKVQVSLLRLIEQKKFTRLGGDRYLNNKARLIAASNSDLIDLVEKGNFRQDLYYRLDVFRIQIPPLRERMEDLELLTDSMISMYNNDFTKHIRNIRNDCLQILRQYDWPGNVRELKNVIQRAVLVCDGPEITPDHLPARLQKEKPDKASISIPVGRTLAEVEREVIMSTLRLTNDNRKLTAEMLGISRRTLYDKLNKYNLNT